MSKPEMDIPMLHLRDIVEPQRGLTYNADQLVESNSTGLAYYNMKSFKKAGGLNPNGTKWFSGNVPAEFLLNESDVIIANTDVTPGSDIIGCAASVPSEHINRATFSHHVTRLRVKNASVSPSYLSRALLLERVRRAMRAESRGTTVKMLDMSAALDVKIGVLPPVEQEVVVSVLDTLDNTIRQTEVIVEKLKQLKQGMLHDVLTRGVGADGELRPSHDMAPELYQKSPLGWRPKDWEICRVASVLTGIDAGKSPDCQDIPAKGDQWGVLKVGAVHPDGLKLSENKVIEESRLKNPAYLVRNGDLLLSRANTFELVGLVCYVTNHPERLMLSDKTLRLSVRANRMTTPFLFWQLQHPKTRTQIEITATGTSGSMKNISQGGIEQIWISRPLIEEQVEITKRLDAAASRYCDEQEKLSKMRELKCGLMDDLLTGQVRVTPLLAK